MARTSTLLVTLLLLVQFPLTLVPSASATHTEDAPNRSFDLLAADGASPGPVTLRIGPTSIPFVRGVDNKTYVAVPSTYAPVTTQDLLGLDVTLTDGAQADCGRVHLDSEDTAHHPALVENFGEAWRATLVAPTVLPGARSDREEDKGIPIPGAQVVPHASAGTETADGVRLQDFTVHVEVLCTTGGDTVDKNWTVTLKNVRVENTPPHVTYAFAPNAPGGGYDPTGTSVGGAPLGPTGIANFTSGTVGLAVEVADLDFFNTAALCDGAGSTPGAKDYTFLVTDAPGSPGALDLLLYMGFPSGHVDAGDFKVGTAGCPGPHGTGGVAKVDYTALHGARPVGNRTVGYDYDQNPYYTGFRIAEVGATDTSIPPTPPSIYATARDEYDNLQATAFTPPKVDAVPPRPPTITQIVQAGAGKAAITWTNASLSVDTVDFVVECYLDVPDPATFTHATLCGKDAWKTVAVVPRDVTVGIAQQTWTAAQALIDPNSPAKTVLFRVRAVDDAGNPSTPWTSSPVNLDPALPSITLLNWNTNAPIVSGQDHAFDRFRVQASDTDALGALPAGSTPSTSRVWAELWRTRPGGTETQYWVAGGKNKFDENANAEERKLGVFTLTPAGSYDGKFAEFKFDLVHLSDCVDDPAPCLETGTYFLKIYAKDAAGNVGSTTTFTLTRDIRDPQFDSGTDMNRVAFPSGHDGTVQQGTFVPVNLKLSDEGSGFKQVRFAFVPSSVTLHRHELAVDTVFGVKAVACMGVDNLSAAPIAYARIPQPTDPAGANACNLRLHGVPVLTGAQVRGVDGHAAFPTVVCTTATPQTCKFETNKKYAGATSPAMPKIMVSTDGLPFGSYKLNVQVVDWAGRQKNQTFGQVFHVVPRLAVVPDSAVLQNGKLNVTLFAGYTDDKQSTLGIDCEPTPPLTITPTSIPTQTQTCVPLSVVIDYLPAGQTNSESNYKPIKALSPVNPKSPEGVDASRSYFAPYGLGVERTDPTKETVRFFKYELKDFALPAGTNIPESCPDSTVQPPCVRVTVKARTKVGTTESQETAERVFVSLKSTVVSTDMTPKKPLTNWHKDREPTFYKAVDATRPASQPADLWFEYAFQRSGLASKDAMVYFRIFDHGLKYHAKAVPGDGSTTQSGSTVTWAQPGAPLATGTYYYRVTAVVNGVESDFSKLAVARPGGGSVPTPPAEAQKAGAPTGVAATGSSGGAISLVWTAVAGATEYRVYRGVDAGVQAVGEVQVASFEDFNLGTGQYVYRVTALTVQGESALSNVVGVGIGSADPPVTGPSTAPAGAPTVSKSVTGSPANDVTLTWAPVPDATGYRVYRGLFQPTIPNVYDCDDDRPLNPARPCRMVYWTNGTADGFDPTKKVRKGHNWTAFVNVSATKDRIEQVDNPDDPDHYTANPTHNPAASSPNAALVHPLGVFPWKDHEVQITRGTYLLEAVAHTKSGDVVDRSRDLARVTRLFRVENTPPAIEIRSIDGVEGANGRVWTDAQLKLVVDVDVRNFVKSVPSNVTAGLVLEEAPGVPWVPGVSSRVREVDATTQNGCVNLCYEMTIDIPAYSHGTRFVLMVNMTPENRTLPGSTFPAGRVSSFIALDLKGPTVTFDLRNQSAPRSGVLVDGTPFFHGTVADEGSGLKNATGAVLGKVEFAVQRLADGRWYNGGSWRPTADGSPLWLATDVSDAGDAFHWDYADADLAEDVAENVSGYRLHARGLDLMSNKGSVVTATAVVDARPPVLLDCTLTTGQDARCASSGAKGNGSSPSGTSAAFAKRTFAIVAEDRGQADEDEMAVTLHLIAPSGRLHKFPMETASATSSDCSFLGVTTGSCWTVELDTQLGWEGEVKYYFHAVDAAGNSMCSYGPCSRQNPELPTFELTDTAAPVIDKVYFDPAVPAAGGEARVVADIREASGWEDGYPQAVFYVDGREVGNGTMRPVSALAVDPLAGGGLWNLSTLQVGFDDLVENMTVCAVVHARDADDQFTSTAGDAGRNIDRYCARVVDNVPPVLTLVSPGADDGPVYVGRNATIDLRVDDVNFAATGLGVTVQVEDGTPYRDDRNVTNATPIRTLGKTLAWTFRYHGGDFPDGANVTFTFEAKDNLSARDTVNLSAVVDGVPPTLGIDVQPTASGPGERVYVGPRSQVTLEATDAVTPAGRIRIEYSVNGGSAQVYTGPFAPTGGDTFRLRYSATDLAGNRREGPEVVYALDKAAPTVTLVSSGGNTTITATDDLVGVDPEKVTLHYKTSATTSDFTAFPFDHVTGNTYTATLGQLAGTFIYYVEVADKVGNVGHVKVDGKDCTAAAPCGLTENTKAPPTIAFAAPAAGANLSGRVEVRWTANAFAGATPSITLAIETVDGRRTIADALAGLQGAHAFDVAALELPPGTYTLVLVIDDGLNPPVEAKRSVTFAAAAPKVFGTPATPLPTQPVAPGAKIETKVPVTDERVTSVKVVVQSGNRVVSTTTVPVANGEFQLSVATDGLAAGVYLLKAQPVYDDGTEGEADTLGTFRVQSAETTDPEGGIPVQPVTLVVVGALAIVLSALGAFRRWKP